MRLIYIIEEESLKAILIPVTAAVFGGLITLAGVLLTIKHSYKLKEQEEIDKNKPLIFPITDEMMAAAGDKVAYRTLGDDDGSGSLSDKDGNIQYKFWPISLFNADHSICVLKGYMINGKNRFFKYNSVLDKNTYNAFSTSYMFKLKDKPESVGLIIGDMLYNTYVVTFLFDIEEDKGIKNIVLKGSYDYILDNDIYAVEDN